MVITELVNKVVDPIDFDLRPDHAGECSATLPEGTQFVGVGYVGRRLVCTALVNSSREMKLYKFFCANSGENFVYKFNYTFIGTAYPIGVDNKIVHVFSIKTSI